MHDALGQWHKVESRSFHRDVVCEHFALACSSDTVYIRKPRYRVIFAEATPTNISLVSVMKFFYTLSTVVAFIGVASAALEPEATPAVRTPKTA